MPLNHNGDMVPCSGYHCFRDEDGKEYGSFEVVYHKGSNGKYAYYWWSCWPGCLPDGDAIGPFNSSRDAYNDAINLGA